MKTIAVKTSKPYDVYIGGGLIEKTGGMISSISKAARVMIVSDENVFNIYGKTAQASLQASGFQTYEYIFSPGEESKTMDTYAGILNALCNNHFNRTDIIVALGGGVTGDLAGFAAATYQRGIDFVQIPTSLLAAVDSSVGGKTGLNLDGGKNQAGAFHQPILVICDTLALGTLPEEEYINGCAEIAKYGMIRSPGMLDRMLTVPVKEDFAEYISECIQIKSDIVAEDEFDHGNRMLLNFGHSLGHAIEQCSNFSIPHGQAVAMGMALVTHAACQADYCSKRVYDKLIEVLSTYGLRHDMPYSPDELLEAALNDKKNTNDSMRLIVPQKPGQCEIVKLPKEKVYSILKKEAESELFN